MHHLPDTGKTGVISALLRSASSLCIIRPEIDSRCNHTFSAVHLLSGNRKVRRFDIVRQAEVFFFDNKPAAEE